MAESSSAKPSRQDYSSQVSDRLERTANDMQEASQQALRQGKDFLHDMEGRIRQKPVQSTMIAAGAGLVLGLLLRR
jgi:ElaB/YqjD/DUF883 family membrane-anchored ribosome-binding protein